MCIRDRVIRFLPIVFVLVVSNIIFMIRDVKKEESLGGSREYFRQEYKKFPKMKMEEKISLGLFVLATVLAFTRQFYQDLLPGLKPAYVFIICAILSFLVHRSNGERDGYKRQVLCSEGQRYCIFSK